MSATILTAGPTPEPGVMDQRAGVSIVVPAYNEAKGVKQVLDQLFAALADRMPAELPYEVIVVDDGSDDGTAAALASCDHEPLRVLRHSTNRGYGAALKSGIRHARHPWILITDADGTYPSEPIAELLQHRELHEMVVGARTGAIREMPWIRRPPSWVLRKLASYMSGRKIPDLNSGFRVMRKDIVERFFNILPDNFSFTSTITIAMLSSGYSVKYLPIDYHRRQGRSKIRPFADTLGFLRLIIRTTMFFDPLRIFLPAAVVFIGAAFVVGIGSYAVLGKLLDTSTLLLFVTGVQLLALGMLADASNRRLR